MIREAHVCVIEINNVSMKTIVRLSTILALLQPALKYTPQILGLKMEEFEKSKNIICRLYWCKQTNSIFTGYSCTPLQIKKDIIESTTRAFRSSMSIVKSSYQFDLQTGPGWGRCLYFRIPQALRDKYISTFWTVNFVKPIKFLIEDYITCYVNRLWNRASLRKGI